MKRTRLMIPLASCVLMLMVACQAEVPVTPPEVAPPIITLPVQEDSVAKPEVIPPIEDEDLPIPNEMRPVFDTIVSADAHEIPIYGKTFFNLTENSHGYVEDGEWLLAQQSDCIKGKWSVLEYAFDENNELRLDLITLKLSENTTPYDRKISLTHSWYRSEKIGETFLSSNVKITQKGRAK